MKDNLRICLLNPMRIPTYPPLNLTYLSSYLKKYSKYQYNIRLVDINCSEDVVRGILEFQPDIVGFTTLSSHIVQICELSNTIRDATNNIFLVCGGAHATIAPQDLLINGKFDIAVVGEGEETFKEVVEAYIENDRKPLPLEKLNNIKGIAFKGDGKIMINPRRELIPDLDAIPHPDRDLLNNEFYNNRYFVMRSSGTYGVTTITGSRGCPYNCIFCCVNAIAERNVRVHSVGYIINEMEVLASKYRAKWLFFTDDILLVNKKMVSDLCEEIIRKRLNKKLKWECQVRSNLVSWDTFALLKLMKRAGCQQIGYGFESGNQRVLTLIKGKGISVEDNQRAIDVTNKSGINVFGSFILGTPTEIYEELMDTKYFILKNYDKLHRFQVTFLVPYPATPAYDLCMQRRLISGDYFAELSADKEGKLKEGMRIFSDTIPEHTLLELKRELDSISLKKIKFKEKLGWFVFNIIHNRSVLKTGINWILQKRK